MNVEGNIVIFIYFMELYGWLFFFFPNVEDFTFNFFFLLSVLTSYITIIIVLMNKQ